MILVPSRQQPLNGNKLLNMSLLLILCLFFNCGISKKTTNSDGQLDYGNGEFDPVSRDKEKQEETITYPNPGTDEKEGKEEQDPESVVEDIKELNIKTEAGSKAAEKDLSEDEDWVDVDDDDNENEQDTAVVNQIKKDIEAQLNSSIKKPSNVNPEDLLGGALSELPITKDAYKIAVLLPFFTNKFGYPHGSISKDSKLALEFYEGAKIAIDQLRSEGLNLTISVFDTKGEKSTVEYLLQRSEVLDADLIIGPVTKVNSKLVADFCLMNNKTIISPLNRRSDIVTQNPLYVQVNPSMETQYVNLLGHVYERYGKGNTIIIAPQGRTGDNRVRYINTANAVASKSASYSPLQSIMVDPRSAGNVEFDVSGYLVSGGNNIVIVPSISQSFVNFVMRELSKIRDSYPIIVLGMHQWEHFEKVDYNYFENLKVHISSDFYLNKSDPQYRSFKSSFFSVNGVNPSENAVKGYDIMLYFSRMIQKYGIYPQHHISGETAQYLHTKFSFNPTYTSSPSDAEQGAAIDSYENKFVNILKFEEYQFRRVN